MRLGAFVTTFDRPEILGNTVARLLEQTCPPDCILVVDNGRSTATRDVVETFGSSVEHHSIGHNSGPAGAGAYGIRTLFERGCEWIYCGDDDDPPLTTDTFERLLRTASAAQSPVGAVGAAGTPWDWRWGRRVRRFAVPLEGPCYVDLVGGGRQLILSREAVRAVGVPKAELFFGQEDFEYCLRIRKAGFHVVVDAGLLREYAAMLPPRWVNQWHRRARPRHTLWRQYYNSRNYIYFMRTEFGCERLALLEALRSLGRIARSWSQGSAYGMEFTKLQLKAIADGYRGRLGLRVSPTAKY